MYDHYRPPSGLLWKYRFSYRFFLLKIQVIYRVFNKNEIFKVKLISTKADSPEDIISLIWAVHREIDLQKKDN